MSKAYSTPTTTDVVIIPRSDHPVSRDQFASTALKVLTRLNRSGYDAFLVGGAIRDILRGETPKDFDVVTNATPEEIAGVFSNCRIIGRRFRLAHIHFGREIIEVATFRASEEATTNDEGQVIRDNTYGTIEQDTLRRDFTVNALYYDIADFSIRDYVGAMQDIDEGLIRIIGDADERYREDPVRIIRAIRFAAKLGMRIEKETEAAMFRQKHLLANVPEARLFEEVNKLFLTGHADASFELLKLYDVFADLMPDTAEVLREHTCEDVKGFRKMINIALAQTDKRIADDKPVTIAFLLAVLYWPVYVRCYEHHQDQAHNWNDAVHLAADEVFVHTAKTVTIPLRFKTMMRDIWTLQPRLLGSMSKRRMNSVLAHRKFRAGYDFLELRVKSGEPLGDWYEFWTAAQDSPDEAFDNLASGLKGRDNKRRRKK